MNSKSDRKLLKSVIESLESPDATKVLEAAREVKPDPSETTYWDYSFKIKVAIVNGDTFRIMMRIPDLMDLYVDITEQCTSDFQEKLFADFFRRGE